MKAETWISDSAQDALAELGAIAQALDLPLTIIGAGARLLDFDWNHDVPGGRATTDWDFAVRVQSWSAFGRFVDALCDASPGFDRVSPHRLRHRTSGTLVDLVPFGEVSEDGRTIDWSETGRVMTVVGMEDTARHARSVEIGQARFRVASLACFVGLKLIAHRERVAERDLEDLHFVLSQYVHYSDDERVYDVLEAHAVEFDDAGARVLGRDIAEEFGEAGQREVREAVEQLLRGGDNGPLAILVPRHADDWDEEHEHVRTTFRELLNGLEDQESASRAPEASVS